MSRKPNSGIYSITNINSGKVYYGSSKNINFRWNCHKSKLRRNIHDNPHLQSSWNKYGESKFIFKIEERLPVEELQKIEQHYLDWCKLFPIWSYNMGFDAISSRRNSTPGPRSEETKKRISNSMKGEKAYWFGKNLSNKTKEKISKKLKGQIISDEIKRKISKSLKGKYVGENSSMCGKHNPCSDQTKKKISISNTGKTRTEEFKKRMSNIKCGENNPLCDRTVYKFTHPKHGMEECIRYKLHTKYNLSSGHISQLVNKRRKSLKGWRIL